MGSRLSDWQVPEMHGIAARVRSGFAIVLTAEEALLTEE